MRRDFLGDSYDAVKRLWQQVLQQRGPLFAEPRFIPQELRGDFTHLTGIGILPASPPSKYSILNDPDTGIYLPDRGQQDTTKSHTSLRAIFEQLQNRSVECVITFDQAHHRKKDVRPVDHRAAKLDWLWKKHSYGFYYVSHAPFLFAFSDKEAMVEVRRLLVEAGIPAIRFQRNEADA